MKKVLTGVLILATAAGANAMENMFKDGVLHFDYKAEELAPAEAAARARLEKDLTPWWLLLTTSVRLTTRCWAMSALLNATRRAGHERFPLLCIYG